MGDPVVKRAQRRRPLGRRLKRALSRIAIRIMAFNLLLVFLPIAGVLYLGSYESKLLAAQRRSLNEEARLLSAALASGRYLAPARAMLAVREQLRSEGEQEPVRLRVIGADGRVMADSHAFRRPPPPRGSGAKRNMLYRAAAAITRPVLGLLRATEPVLAEGDYYERSERLLGQEVRSALEGDTGHVERISPDRRSVTAYVAHPVFAGGDVIGAVVASQSTFTILQDLYTVRLGIVRIFGVSVVLALILSFLVATTIVKPLRQLRLDARAIVDRRGHLRGRFRGSQKYDEIGDLARALERLTRRLDNHVRFIESFAADVSHEFKNPLASIRTATEMLAEVDEPAQRRRFLRMVEQEIARMESLLSGVREVTLIDAQISSETRQRVDLTASLGRIVEGFTLRERGRVEIRLQVPPQPVLVEASEERLDQVLVNVLENALSFSPDGGTVTIDVTTDERSVIVVISDEGPGIAEADLPKVFDRFFTHRPDEPRNRMSHTGLGLSIVRAIVEGYGGTVSASNDPGGGARFEIRLRRF